jgi:uncharacterized membrane protein
MSQWKDEIKKNGEASSSIKIGCLNVFVTNAHRDFKGQWIVRCANFAAIDFKSLSATDLQSAKQEAIAMIAAHVKIILQELENAS